MPFDNRRILAAVAGCCLLAAASGCRCHRAGRGFVVRSQWSLECDNVPRLSFAQDGDDEPAVARPSPEPERLRWRIRRKGYQLASRLFGRGEAEAQRDLPQTAEAETPAPTPDVLKNPPAEARLASAEEDGDLRIPDANFSQPESWRPDLAID